MLRIKTSAELIRWACARAGLRISALSEKFPTLPDWLSGDGAPTLKQLQDFARATRTPFGYFFLPEPPVEVVPIPDFRTVGSEAIRRPSPDLLDTIHLCQQRQDWYRQEALVNGEAPLVFIGSTTVKTDVVSAATRIRQAVGFELSARDKADTIEAALRLLTNAADSAGILVMISGIVGHNTHRSLDPAEFRGFALSDPYAPLIFINGADSKSGQMFSLAHELAHLWLGESGVSDATPASSSTDRAGVERWCNAVAAEVLVPMAEFQTVYRRHADAVAVMRHLSRLFKVSTLVILRRMLDAQGLTRDRFQSLYASELARLKAAIASHKRTKGGNFYATTRARVSPRFARAVLASTWEGRSTFTEAFRLLGCRNVTTLESFGKSLGMTDYLSGGAV